MTRLLIIGAGLAGVRAAEAARAVDDGLDITLVGDEPCAPYARPPLSKAFIKDAWPTEKLLVKPLGWYDQARVTLRTGVAAAHIDLPSRKVSLDDGSALPFDRLIVATGSRPRRLVSPEIDETCVGVLRSEADARHMRDRLNAGASLVVIGGGVIGLELAASARTMGCRAMVLEAGPRLMGRCVPVEVSQHIERLHTGQGVEVLYGIQISSIQRAGDAIRVVTNAGVFMAHAVVAGIGVTPNSELAGACGLRVEDGIVVDECGRTGEPDVFAAGEVTRHYNPMLGESVRVESWQIADRQAAAVGRTAAGAATAYGELPWFWSDQYDMNLQVLGSFNHVTELVRRAGSQPGGSIVLGLDGGQRLVGAACIDSGRDMSLLKRIVATRCPLEPRMLADANVTLRDVHERCKEATSC